MKAETATHRPLLVEPFYVGGDLRQVVVELMVTIVQTENCRLRHGLRVEIEVGDRRGFIIATMIEMDWDGRQLCTDLTHRLDLLAFLLRQDQ